MTKRSSYLLLTVQISDSATTIIAMQSVKVYIDILNFSRTLSKWNHQNRNVESNWKSKWCAQSSWTHIELVEVNKCSGTLIIVLYTLEWGCTHTRACSSLQGWSTITPPPPYLIGKTHNTCEYNAIIKSIVYMWLMQRENTDDCFFFFPKFSSTMSCRVGLLWLCFHSSQTINPNMLGHGMIA